VGKGRLKEERYLEGGREERREGQERGDLQRQAVKCIAKCNITTATKKKTFPTSPVQLFFAKKVKSHDLNQLAFVNKAAAAAAVAATLVAFKNS